MISQHKAGNKRQLTKVVRRISYKVDEFEADLAIYGFRCDVTSDRSLIRSLLLTYVYIYLFL